MKKKLTKKELLDKLEDLKEDSDTEQAHYRADNLLIEYINDKEIEKSYDEISKWYA